MEPEEFNEMFKEVTKWVTESEFERLKCDGDASVAIQRIIFSPEHNLMFGHILSKLSKEQVNDAIDTIAEMMKKLNGKEMGVIIVTLTYLITETLRKFGEEIQGEIV